MRYKAIIGVILSGMLLSGCIIAAGDRSGDGDWERTRGQRPTIGQELLDLDRALEAGVLTQSEYERTRARILERQ